MQSVGGNGAKPGGGETTGDEVGAVISGAKPGGGATTGTEIGDVAGDDD